MSVCQQFHQIAILTVFSYLFTTKIQQLEVSPEECLRFKVTLSIIDYKCKKNSSLSIMLMLSDAFSASVLLVGWQEGHPVCKTMVVVC